MLMYKLPQEIRLIISRQFGTGSWNITLMMETVCTEIEARERSVKDQPHPHKKKPSVPPTSSTFLNDSSQSTNCTYCGQSHSPTACTVISDVNQRKEILRKAGRCFNV